MINVRVQYHDRGPDNHGRRRFTLIWEDPQGVFRPELSKDGQPVGFRRAQCFRADPAGYATALKDATVLEPEIDS